MGGMKASVSIRPQITRPSFQPRPSSTETFPAVPLFIIPSVPSLRRTVPLLSRSQFPGNQIPANLLNPVALNRPNRSTRRRTHRIFQE